ncbi:3-oxoacyl-[acyl-carrier protein] reductase [Lactobacillus colini]|uniref:3-oxoacyl-[acyl-carrier protein] reductase n=1 Tax=Lactobacillus colini TaxID=1819254 RepID=A0ABS4MD61_9LACO|nr:3-oxoacyl-ACP reductase family protein [Lactobacillus colini]MBP2057627.1 3-oxoacyl-[acyl-carrier protein] reductase [Lactobacillus colini]
MNLTNKIVLITGSTKGLGKEMALSFAKQGAKLILNGRHEDIDEDFKQELSFLGADYKYLATDLSTVDLKDYAKDAWDIFGKIDILINNAGINRDKMFIGMREADFDQVIDLDLKVPFFLSKHVMKRMNRQRSGVIINMSSVVGIHGNAGQANYAAAKAGLIGLTKSLAREGALRNIRVNAIAPGMIATDMTEALSDRVKDDILTRIPLARFGNAEEVAQAAIFLTQNDYVTGQTIVVDGGMTI